MFLKRTEDGWYRFVRIPDERNRNGANQGRRRTMPPETRREEAPRRESRREAAIEEEAPKDEEGPREGGRIKQEADPRPASSPSAASSPPPLRPKARRPMKIRQVGVLVPRELIGVSSNQNVGNEQSRPDHEHRSRRRHHHRRRLSTVQESCATASKPADRPERDEDREIGGLSRRLKNLATSGEDDRPAYLFRDSSSNSSDSEASSDKTRKMIEKDWLGSLATDGKFEPWEEGSVLDVLKDDGRTTKGDANSSTKANAGSSVHGHSRHRSHHHHGSRQSHGEPPANRPTPNTPNQHADDHASTNTHRRREKRNTPIPTTSATTIPSQRRETTRRHRLPHASTASNFPVFDPAAWDALCARDASLPLHGGCLTLERHGDDVDTDLWVGLAEPLVLSVSSTTLLAHLPSVFAGLLRRNSRFSLTANEQHPDVPRYGVSVVLDEGRGHVALRELGDLRGLEPGVADRTGRGFRADFVALIRGVHGEGVEDVAGFRNAMKKMARFMDCGGAVARCLRSVEARQTAELGLAVEREPCEYLRFASRYNARKTFKMAFDAVAERAMRRDDDRDSFLKGVPGAAREIVRRKARAFRRNIEDDALWQRAWDALSEDHIFAYEEGSSAK
ncbi:hypothetical protein SLS58_007300 [Diplodia intermedia]|uniref:Uncharacterized protein n=1 Tax=Diplodia intermedia TaxID=856260 RepID=A0ABR3TKE5_9PEZI